jgi:fucose 4-O-acetylase-like acetyltransferase
VGLQVRIRVIRLLSTRAGQGDPSHGHVSWPWASGLGRLHMSGTAQTSATGRQTRPEQDLASRASGTQRIVPIDNFKSVLVAWVIGCHALMGYAAIGGWPYEEVQETTLSPRVEYVLTVLIGPTGLFAMGTFFFLAGLFGPVAINRLGPARFAWSRLIRLGVPWILFMLLIWPFFMWLAYRAAGNDLSYWQAFRGRTPFLDSGPLWFVQVLLYVSLGYALWTWLGWGRRVRPAAIAGRHLLVVAAAIAATSFAIRLWFPARSQQILDLHLWQWPQCVGMFCLGAMVSGQGWAREIPSEIARRCRIAVLVTLVGAVGLALVVVSNFARQEASYLGGWRWQAVALDAVEASLVVAGSIALLAFCHRRLTSESPILRGAARGAYSAFMLQVPVLLTLEMAARPLPIPAEAKAVLVGGLAILGSFALGWFLVTRTKLGRIL